MAEESGQEKTEQPTGRRLSKAREKGQVPRSKELNTMVVLMSAALSLLLFGGILARSMERVMRGSFDLRREMVFDTNWMGLLLYESTIDALIAMSPFLIGLFVATLMGPVGAGGWVFSVEALMPKLSKMNPITGIKRMFSTKSLAELVKSVLKVTLVMTMAWFILKFDMDDILAISNEPMVPAMAHAMWTVGWSFLLLTCALVLIAAIDVPYQAYEHRKELKMTKQEVKDEMKDTEGKPEVKSRIRRLQYEMAQRRMMQDVPKADVVITNPTHFAVALKYDGKTMAAPVLLAKGSDLMAMKIQEIARAHSVEILQAPPLARAVYHHTEVGREIPAGLYVAVAQVLAYIFQLRRFRRGQAPKPGMPDMPVPDDLRRDS